MRVIKIKSLLIIICLAVFSVSAPRDSRGETPLPDQTGSRQSVRQAQEDNEPPVTAVPPSAGGTVEHPPATGESVGPPPASAEQPSADKEPAPADKPAAMSPGTVTPERPVTRPAQPAAPPQAPRMPEQFSSYAAQPREDDYIILNFDNADLRDVINTITAITEKSFILSPGLDARITIHSAGRIPTSEALSVFESVLEVNGMGLVKSGRFYKIISSSAAKQKPIEVYKGNEIDIIPYEDRIITQITQVDYVPAAEVGTVLQPMISQFGAIVPNPRNNLLIISDTAANIRRILAILKEIDQDAFQNTRMGFFQPKYSDVSSITEELTEIINVLNLGREGTVALVPVERINSLVVFCSSPSLLKSVEGWFRKLDEEITTGQNIFVYNVQNVKAESIASILKTVYNAETTTAGRTTTTTRTVTTAQQRRTAATAARRTAAARQGGGDRRIEIVIFEPGNSLVVLAPPGIYRDIVETVKKLDVYPQEVLIEVIIAEVTLSDADRFGIQWSALHSVHMESDPDFTGLGQSTADPVGLKAPVPPDSIPSLMGGATSGISYILFKPERLVAMLHALASKGKVDILSSPRLLVRNQEEASIEVGEDIPTATSTTSSTDVDTLTQNIEYRTVGIKLNIKPSINDERTVVLDIEQEVSDLLDNQPVGELSYPAFSTRKAKTSIIVPDKQAVVIGGIIKEKKDKSYQGIPLLSAIPLLGNLFRYTVDSKSKTELVILLTPHVISNREEADVLTAEFMNKLTDVKEFLDEKRSQIDVPILSEEITPPQSDEQ